MEAVQAEGQPVTPSARTCLLRPSRQSPGQPYPARVPIATRQPASQAGSQPEPGAEQKTVDQPLPARGGVARAVVSPPARQAALPEPDNQTHLHINKRAATLFTSMARLVGADLHLTQTERNLRQTAYLNWLLRTAPHRTAPRRTAGRRPWGWASLRFPTRAFRPVRRRKQEPCCAALSQWGGEGTHFTLLHFT